jgi:galactofuranose transport system substrate-binding protein
MALGAIQAIEEYGLRPGKDIKIVSVDAARGAFEAMIAGKLNATVECNPLLGPQFFELALKVVNGESIPKWVPSIETVFFPEDAIEILPPANTNTRPKNTYNRSPSSWRRSSPPPSKEN